MQEGLLIQETNDPKGPWQGQRLHPITALFALEELERPLVVNYEIDDPLVHPIDSSFMDEEAVSNYSKWSIGLVLAPDFTTVGQLNEFTRPGLDVGVTVSHSISRKLSIGTGVILTRKLYNTTDVEQYTVPYNFWSQGWTPDEIFANCKVIDIPINVRYLLVDGKRTSLSASAGLSSYLMLTEEYDYDYGDWPNNGRQPEGWEVRNENNHFFGVYNLSAVLSRRVTQKISLEAEPYLKNSLGGVGWGQVQLKSTGVLFHMKYNF